MDVSATSAFFGARILDEDCCEVCGVTGSAITDPKRTLKKCSRCKFVFYCSQACQKYDHKKHQLFCKNVAKEDAIVNREEPKLRKFIREEGEKNGHPWTSSKSKSVILVQRFPRQKCTCSTFLEKVLLSSRWRMRHSGILRWSSGRGFDSFIRNTSDSAQTTTTTSATLSLSS